MKYLGVNFSARRDGNCKRVGEYIRECVQGDVELVHANEFILHPCGPCEYECAAGRECPIQDGVGSLTEELYQADQIYFIMPTYNGHFPSTYYMFMERMSPVFHEEEAMKEFLGKLSIIYIGNYGSGAENLIKELQSMYEEYNLPPRVLHLAPKKYGKKAVKDNLLEVPQVKQAIKLFTLHPSLLTD